MQGELLQQTQLMMRKVTIFVTVILFLSSAVYCQTRTITGKVIDETFQPISGASIFTSDTSLLGKSDSVGNFSINLPISTNFLRFGAVGLEWKYIHLRNNCNNIEVILLLHSTYDFISLKEVDRLRKKRFKKLPKLHAKAYEKGLLSTEDACYDDIFVSLANRQNKD